MAWRFTKSKNIGQFKTTVSKKGIGTNFGLLGFRFGVSADGRKYWSFGLRGTGLHYIKYY
jgi:hypothetical protein